MNLARAYVRISFCPSFCNFSSTWRTDWLCVLSSPERFNSELHFQIKMLIMNLITRTKNFTKFSTHAPESGSWILFIFLVQYHYIFLFFFLLSFAILFGFVYCHLSLSVSFRKPWSQKSVMEKPNGLQNWQNTR